MSGKTLPRNGFGIQLSWGLLSPALVILSCLGGPALSQEVDPPPEDPLAGIFRIEKDETAEIDAHGECKLVTNRNDLPVLVPTRSPEEWSIGDASFLFLTPTGIEIAPCVTRTIEEILTSFTVSPFFDLDDQALSTITYSNVAQMRGDAPAMAFSVTGGPDAAASINDGAWVTAGTINPGDRIRLRTRTSASYSTTVTTSLQVEDYSGMWNAKTAASSTSCMFSSSTVSMSGWGTWWGDRISLLYAGSLPGRTAFTNMDADCSLTGPVPIEIVSYDESTLSGTPTASGGNAKIRINGGPEVSQAIYTPGDSLEILYDTAEGHVLSTIKLRLNGYGTASYGQGTVSAKPGITMPTSFNYGSKTGGWGASMVSNAYTLTGGTTSATWYPSTMAVESAPWTWSPTVTMTASSGPSTTLPAEIKIVKNGVKQASLPVTASVGDTIALMLKAPSTSSGTMQYRMMSTTSGRLGGSSDYFVANFSSSLSTGNFDSTSAAKNTTITSNSLWAAPLATCQTASVNVPSGFNSLSTTINVNGVNKGRFGVSICNGDEVKLITKTPTLGTGSATLTLTVSGWTKTWAVSYY